MSQSADETYSVYDERRIRARKVHRCGACADLIEPGHVYTRVGIVFDGQARTVKRCLRCQAIHEHLRELGDWDVWPAERLDCGMNYEEEWGDCPPEIAALAFKTGADMQAAAERVEAERDAA